MPRRSDRIRRILADAPAPRDAKPEDPKPPARGQSASRSVRARLRALGVDRALQREREQARGSDGSGVDVPDDDRPLVEMVEGAERTTPHGRLLYVERRVSLETVNGSIRVHTL